MAPSRLSVQPVRMALDDSCPEDEARAAIAVSLLNVAARRDAGLVDRVTGLINEVYASAERGLWQEGATRTTRSEVAGLIGARQMAVATVDGRQLIVFAERIGRTRGLQAMQLELLVPRMRRHPSKEFLDNWYRRIGYRVIRTISVDDVQAGLSALLATPCQFVIYEKSLA
jgi:hypothetical protein